jgi:hypothetical protein
MSKPTVSKLRVSVLSVVLLGALAASGASYSAPPPTSKVVVFPAKHTGKCPHLFQFSGWIQSSVPGPVTYRWIRSDGAMGPVQNLMFAKPGKLPVAVSTWTLGGPGMVYNGWERVQILTPVAAHSNAADFKLVCK